MSNDEKDLFYNVNQLKESLQKIKVLIGPLAANDKTVLRVIERHEILLDLLSDKIETVDDKYENKLELVQGDLNEIKSSFSSHLDEQKDIEIEKSYAKFDYYDIRTKIGEKTISEEDIIVIQEVIKRNPGIHRLVGLRAEALISMGKKEEAIEYLNQHIHENPQSPYLWYSKGLILVSEWKESLKALQNAKKYALEDDWWLNHQIHHLNREIFVEMEDVDSAYAENELALHYSSTCITGLEFRAWALGEFNKYPEAIEAANQALEISEDSYVGWMVKGYSLRLQKEPDFKGALEAHERARDIDESDWILFFNIAALLTEKEEFEEALDAIDKSIALFSENACSYCKKIYILEKLGQTEEIKDLITKAVNAPMHKRKLCRPFIYYAAMFFASNGFKDEAVKLAEKESLKDDPDFDYAKFLDDIN